MKKEFLGDSANKRILNGGISLSLIEKGVPMSLAFNLQMFFRKGKTETVNHDKTVMSHVKAKLKRAMFESVGVRKVNGPEDVLDYLELPRNYLEDIKSVMNAGKGYSHVAKVGHRSYLVRTNGSGHKVMRTKEISDVFGE